MTLQQCFMRKVVNFYRVATWLLLLAFTFLSAGCTVDEAEDTLPNILILIADDAGWRDFGTYGNPYIRTPNIDDLANNGLKANQAFLTTPQCSPSRISILSGRYPHATGAEDLHMPMPKSLTIIPSYLKRKGYFSGYLKKGHFGPHGHNQFDWHSKEIGDIEKFIDSANGQPFFLWAGFTDPHRPYKDNIIEDPQSPDEVVVPAYLVDDDDTRLDLSRYYNYIRRMDAKIGDYVQVLRARGLLENTLIIFLSDNGAAFPRAKGTVYDSGVKTPLIIQWPKRVPKGVQTDALLSVIDLAPTLLKLVGIPLPEQFQGTPIEGLFSDTPITGREYIFTQRNWHTTDEHIRSIRSYRYKLIKNAYLSLPSGVAADIGKSLAFKSLLRAKENDTLTAKQSRPFEKPRQQYEFYDMLNDPEEFTNLISDPELNTIIQEFKLQLNSWIEETNDFPPEVRRRPDNTDRGTGKKFDKTKLPDWISR